MKNNCKTKKEMVSWSEMMSKPDTCSTRIYKRLMRIDQRTLEIIWDYFPLRIKNKKKRAANCLAQVGFMAVFMETYKRAVLCEALNLKKSCVIEAIDTLRNTPIGDEILRQCRNIEKDPAASCGNIEDILKYGADRHGLATVDFDDSKRPVNLRAQRR